MYRFFVKFESLAEKMRNAQNRAQGEIVVYAESGDRFVIMKQITPPSCETLTFTQEDCKDVLTAYRFEQDELVRQLKGDLDGGPGLDP